MLEWLWWRFDCRWDPGQCSRQTDQQRWKPGSRTCRVSAVVHAKDFVQQNGDASRCGVGHTDHHNYKFIK